MLRFSSKHSISISIIGKWDYWFSAAVKIALYSSYSLLLSWSSSNGSFTLHLIVCDASSWKFEPEIYIWEQTSSSWFYSAISISSLSGLFWNPRSDISRPMRAKCVMLTSGFVFLHSSSDPAFSGWMHCTTSFCKGLKTYSFCFLEKNLICFRG